MTMSMSDPSQANIAPFLKPRNNPLPPHSAIVSAISRGPHNSPTAAGRVGWVHCPDQKPASKGHKKSPNHALLNEATQPC